MNIKAYNHSCTGEISISEFFSYEKEFETNKDLIIQTTRYLKVFSRHISHISQVVDILDDEYFFKVNGETRTYTIHFKVINGFIFLLKIV